jgi:hypothetical protein
MRMRMRMRMRTNVTARTTNDRQEDDQRPRRPRDKDNDANKSQGPRSVADGKERRRGGIAMTTNFEEMQGTDHRGHGLRTSFVSYVDPTRIPSPHSVARTPDSHSRS